VYMQPTMAMSRERLLRTSAIGYIKVRASISAMESSTQAMVKSQEPDSSILRQILVVCGAPGETSMKLRGNSSVYDVSMTEFIFRTEFMSKPEIDTAS
jgi:hypothetical protein